MSVDDVQGKKNLPQSENNHLTLRDETETCLSTDIDIHNENINVMQKQFGCVYCIIIVLLYYLQVRLYPNIINLTQILFFKCL